MLYKIQVSFFYFKTNFKNQINKFQQIVGNSNNSKKLGRNQLNFRKN